MAPAQQLLQQNTSLQGLWAAHREFLVLRGSGLPLGRVRGARLGFWPGRRQLPLCTSCVPLARRSAPLLPLASCISRYGAAVNVCLTRDMQGA